MSKKILKNGYSLQSKCLKKNRALCSNESTFNLFQSNGKTYIRRCLNKALDPWHTVKIIRDGGSSYMVWSAVSWRGVGLTVRIELIMY